MKELRNRKYFLSKERGRMLFVQKISTLFTDYSCKEYTNKTYRKYNHDEELTILLKKNKIHILYISIKERGVLHEKFDQVAKILDE
ncbi:hypothetical protein NV63_12600 [Elizabethkingia anophelis]|nr:hypothetical protein NV63_12600 [Elizabethkingia anophelis]